MKAARKCNTLLDVDEVDGQVEYNLSRRDRIPTTFASYLTLPVTIITLDKEEGPGFVSYAVTHTIQPSALEPLTEDRKFLFTSALDTLNLHAAHTYTLVDDKTDKPEWMLDFEDQGDSDGQDNPVSKKRNRKQHMECLECGTLVCSGQSAIASAEPKLMLLGYGEMDSYADGIM